MDIENIIAYDPRGIPVTLEESKLNWMLEDKHPELNKRIKKNHVVETISSPQQGIIYLSKQFADSNIYYRRFAEFKSEVMVVVSFDHPGYGLIRTIHFCLIRSNGEKIVWPPKLTNSNN
jgi:hypothetical protein